MLRPALASSAPTEILLTGVTGFVGKVVLSELLRNRHALQLQRVWVVVRPRRGSTAAERWETLRQSPALSEGDTSLVNVVEGDLANPNCGIGRKDREAVQSQVTHVVHCAASVDFDLPVADAARANITAALNVLALAKGCQHLVRMVSVSTAYVTPHRGAYPVFDERLAPLPFDPAATYADIQAGRAHEDELMAQTGHPNTYTLTKCIAEHLLVANQGNVPLTLVRPSIISASLHHPMPGWIDSHAAFAGFVAVIGLGYLRAVVVDDATRLDVVPVDVVSDRVLRGAFDATLGTAIPSEDVAATNADADGRADKRTSKRQNKRANKHERHGAATNARLVQAVAGLDHSCRIDQCYNTITRYFSQHPVKRSAKMSYAGDASWRFLLQHLRHHEVPSRLAEAWSRLQGNTKMARGAKRLRTKLGQLNRTFPYFTNHTFDFRSSAPIVWSSPDNAPLAANTNSALSRPLGQAETSSAPDGSNKTGNDDNNDHRNNDGFSAPTYIRLVCEGVHRHLLGGEPSHATLGGRKHKDPLPDSAWVLGQPSGNVAIRGSAYAFKKGLRLCTDQVTFDTPSFEAAMAARSPEETVVLLPSHRSYMDFLLGSYLAFSKPDLNISIPHIAAAEEFAKIPGFGWLFRQTHAFYLKRGRGREDLQLTEHVRQLVDDKQSLMFFVEGTRSRSRHYLPPHRGLLRCLQNSGQRFRLLPIAISYERVPEERSFAEQLEQGSRADMHLTDMVQWGRRLLQGQVNVGQVHMRCGQPLVLGPDSNVHDLSRNVVAQLQANTVCTLYHLRTFLQRHPIPGADVTWLRRAIESRGGTVLDGALDTKEPVLPAIARTFEHQWMHHFFPDLLALLPGNSNHPALEHFVDHQGFALQQALHHGNNNVVTRMADHTERNDPRLRALLRSLFEPVCQDYASLAEFVASQARREGGWRHFGMGRTLTRHALCSAVPHGDRGTLEIAVDGLVSHSLLRPAGQRHHYRLGTQAQDGHDFAANCAWPQTSTSARSTSARSTSARSTSASKPSRSSTRRGSKASAA